MRVTNGDVASNAARGSPHPQLHDRRHALLRLLGCGELDREPAEGGERKHETGGERAEEQRRDHVEPSGLDVRPDQEQHRGAQQQTGGALAQAHGAQAPRVACSGIGTSSSNRAMRPRQVGPLALASFANTRCASAGIARALTSSGST